MSLFAAFETQPTPESQLRIYDQASLIGKGLQRLSYFVESQYVTRRFKNRLKSLGLFNPAYKKQDRQQVFFERPAIRRYSEYISNRKFKHDWIMQHRSIKGLKDQPRTLVEQQPLHVGTVIHSQGVFHPNPFLDRRERKLVRKPCLRAKLFLAKAVKKVRMALKAISSSDAVSEETPATGDPLKTTADGENGRVRAILISKDGKYPMMLGGMTFPNEEVLMDTWSAHTRNFRFFRSAKHRSGNRFNAIVSRETHTIQREL